MSEPNESVVGSILFTDLVGFTEYTGVAGDAAALAVLDAQTALVRRVLAGIGDGRIVKEIGDGMLIWFSSPERAVAGSATILSELDGARSRDGFPLAVRMGLHRGPVMPRGDDLVGQAVNIAARIADLAGPGELLASEAAIESGAAEPAPSPIGPVRVKGVAEPIWLHRL